MRNRAIVSESGSWNIFAIIFGSIRKSQCFQWIHINIFWELRKVYVDEKTCCDKERLTFFLHQLDRFGGDHPVNLFFILPFRSQAAKAA